MGTCALYSVVYALATALTVQAEMMVTLGATGCHTPSTASPPFPLNASSRMGSDRVTRVENKTSSTNLAAISTHTSTSLSLPQRLRLADDAAERYSLLPADEDFVFDFNQLHGDSTSGDGGSIVVANRKSFAALAGTGSSLAVGQLGPCGINTMHVHPRSAELQIVVQGRLITEMMPEDGVLQANGEHRVVRNEIAPYQMTLFYQGSSHLQFNPDCTNSTFISSFADEDAGTDYLFHGAWAFSNETLARAVKPVMETENTKTVRGGVPLRIYRDVEQCLQRCNDS